MLLTFSYESSKFPKYYPILCNLVDPVLGNRITNSNFRKIQTKNNLVPLKGKYSSDIHVISNLAMLFWYCWYYLLAEQNNVAEYESNYILFTSLQTVRQLYQQRFGVWKKI